MIRQAHHKVTNCLFCRIGDKEIKTEVIWENGANMAFLDIYPRAPGHVVVIPKAHRETILDVPDKELESLFSVVKKATSILSKTFQPDGFTIGINHGKASGQAVDHLHIHVIPRYFNDKGSSIHSVVDNKSGETIQEIAEKIRKENNK